MKTFLALLLFTSISFAQANVKGSNTNWISTINSSTTALDSAGVFTGAWEACWDYDSVRTVIKTNKGASLKVQFAIGKSDTLLAHQNAFNYTANDSITNVYTAGVAAAYYRVICTNDSTAQAKLILTTILKK